MADITTNVSLLYKPEPAFGLDIGRSSVKVMQITNHPSQDVRQVEAYGSITFSPEAVSRGVIVRPDVVAAAIKGLFTTRLIGSITTRRVAMSVPNEYSYSSVLNLPLLNERDIETAVYAEAEQAIPVALDSLYISYEVSARSDKGLEVTMVAAPREIIDSYLALCQLLHIELVLVETNIIAVSRMVTNTERVGDLVTITVDLGSTAADLSLYDGQTLRITSTVDSSSDRISNLIAKHLGISPDQAFSIKSRYGIEKSRKQSQILDAVGPELNKLVAELKKLSRYYTERGNNKGAIDQIIVLGGGANLPGLSTYLTNALRTPTRLYDPWRQLSFGHLQPPQATETSLYATAGGLSLVNPKELITQ